MALDKPIVSAVFFQADTIRGYRFWDEAGVLANEYSKRFQSVNYGSPGVLYCSNPKDPGDILLELRVGPSNIWLSYRAGVLLGRVQQESARLVDWIARAIYVTQFSRLGLRVHMLWGNASLDQVMGQLRSRVLQTQNQGWDSLGNVTGGALTVDVTRDRLTARFSLAPVQSVQTQIQTKVPGIEQPPVIPEVRLPDYSIMLDVDVVDNHTTDSIDIKPYLSQAIAFIDSRLVPSVAHRFAEEAP